MEENRSRGDNPSIEDSRSIEETVVRKRLSRRTLVWGALILIVLIAVFIAFLVHKRAPRVEISVAQTQTIENQVFAAGVIKPVQRQVVFATDLTSPVTQFLVQPGDAVKAGQLLASTANETASAQLDAAKTSLQQAQAALNQTEQQQNAAPLGFQSQFAGTLSQEKAAVAQAQAQLAQAQAAYDSTAIRSKLNGIVLEVNPDGIAPDGSQAPVLEIVGAQKQVVTNVSQVDAVHLRKGQRGTIQSDAFPSQKWTGTVNYIAPFASTASGSSGQVEVHIDMPSSLPIPFGYAVNVHIISQTHKGVVVVPYASLVQSGSDYAVYVVDSTNHVHEVAVQLGITTDTEVEVTSGLKAGQLIVDNPSATLVSGEKVAVVNQ